MQVHDIVIIGSGPAGYTAAIYAARANLQPVLIEGWKWGGALQNTTEVENFPGFPDGILGPHLMTGMRDQAARFGTQFVTDDAERIRPHDGPEESHLVHTAAGGPIAARAVVVATGADPVALRVPGEQALTGRGVSTCATCDGAFFAGKPVAVIGGGDSAFEEALHLSKLCSSVTIVHRRDEFRASKIMIDRAREAPNVYTLTNRVVIAFEEAHGDIPRLARLRLSSPDGTAESVLHVQGAFVAIGHRPNKGLLDGIAALDEQGYVLVQRPTTNIIGPDGIFACGDLTDPSYRQAITAAGSGCQAALDAERYLRDR